MMIVFQLKKFPLLSFSITLTRAFGVKCLSNMKETQQDLHSGDVVAHINYFPATGIPIPKSAWKTPFLDDHNEHTRSMLIRDVRTSGRTFDLDTNGFTFVTLPWKDRVTRESTDDEVKREYYPEVEELVKKLYTSFSITYTGRSNP
jgi:hypothetical protein